MLSPKRVNSTARSSAPPSSSRTEARPENAIYQGKSVAEMAALRGQEPIDALLTLSVEEDLETALAGDDPFGSAGNLLGLPAIVVPGPLVRGLPTAMQLLGPAWSEELLCATATALEEVTPWAAQKPQPARQ